MADPSRLPTDHDVERTRRDRSCKHALRRSGRGLRQDDGARRSRVRAGRVRHRRTARSRRSRSPRRPLQSCGLESARSSKSRETAEQVMPRWQSWAKRPCRHSTHSLVGCSPSTGSRSACLRGSRCATRWARRSTSKRSWRELAAKLFDPKGTLAEVVVAGRRARPQARPHPRDRRIALHRSYDRLRESDASGCGQPRRPSCRRSTFVVRPVLVDAEHRRRSGARRVHRPRRQKAESTKPCIDILRTEDVLPKRGAAAAKKALKALLFELRSDAITALVPALAASVLDGQTSADARGALLFHDLLVLARDALRDADVRVRRPPRGATSGCSIDEFQDTDPLQIEIAVLLASSDPDIAARRGTTTRCARDAGRLFFVGDPKQSIYRFRRADVELYRHAQEVFAHTPRNLTENFRTVESIVEFVNVLFSVWMTDSSRLPARLREAHAAHPRSRSRPGGRDHRRRARAAAHRRGRAHTKPKRS